MKLVTFEHSGKQSIGALVGEQVANLSLAGFPSSMRRFIEEGPDTLQKAQNVVSQGSCQMLALQSVKLLAPIPTPPRWWPSA